MTENYSVFYTLGCHVIDMMFLQVLEPFSLSEQEFLDSEEEEAAAYSTAVLVLSQTEINSVSSDVASPTISNECCNAFLKDADLYSVPLNSETDSDPFQCLTSSPQPSNNTRSEPLYSEESQSNPALHSGLPAVHLSETVSVESINEHCNEIAPSLRSF